MNRKLGFLIAAGMLFAALAPAHAQCLKITQIYIETEHEFGGFLAKPEIELYQAQGFVPSFDFFKGDRRALAIFNGGYLVGLQQGSRPDINDTGKWYTLNPPVIVTGNGLGLLLVEDDNTAGTFYGPSSFWNGFSCSRVNDPAVPVGLIRCQTPDFSSDQDDVYRGMIVLTGLFSTSQDVTLDLGEWRVKVNSSCV
ncbi:MAG TPA: hypothetical protein VH394_01660 [Thermoanaerobaculia bacterium]|jgi:hypothetical protein|nr:hypothetical protein [Thermoanaerobaculia bacterium]